MKFVSQAFVILFLLSGCMTNPNSIFRPDFKNEPKSTHTNPPADNRYAAKQNITRSIPKTKSTDLSHHNKLDSGGHKRTARIPSELKSRVSEKTPLSVDQYYRQQLNLHRGDTVPSYAPPPLQKRKALGCIDYLAQAKHCHHRPQITVMKEYLQKRVSPAKPCAQMMDAY